MSDGNRLKLNIIFVLIRDVSSVGSERLLDRQEVDSSNLSRPTHNLTPSVKILILPVRFF